MFTQTSQFDAIRARADESRRAFACSDIAWRINTSRPAAESALGTAFAAMAIVPVYQGTLGFPFADAKHIGRRPGVASP